MSHIDQKKTHEADKADNNTPRPGEIALETDPATLPPDAGLVFIGRVRSPWTSRETCPKNMGAAREAGGGATIELNEPYRAGLDGMERFSHLVVLTWLDRSRRDLVVQHPRRAEAARGVFALRSPVRPNPIGLHVVELAGIDAGRGLLHLNAIDVLDGTPLLDIKPYYVSTDSIPDASGGPR